MTQAGLLLFLVVLLSHPSLAQTPRDSALARRLTLAALDQEALFHYDTAIVLLRAARRADSSDVTAEYYYIVLMQGRLEHAVLLREYRADADPSVWIAGLCWRPNLLFGIAHRIRMEDVVRPARASPATTCSTAILAQNDNGSDSSKRSSAERGTRVTPGIPGGWTGYARSLVNAGQIVRADSVLEEGERLVGHPLPRSDLTQQRIAMRLDHGDTAGALALYRAFRGAAIRDGRPAIILRLLGTAAGWPALNQSEGGPEAIKRRVLALYAASGDWRDRARTLLGQGKERIDFSEPARAIPLLSEAVRVADSVRIPDLSLMAYTLRGRAYLKMGRLAEAERDLQRAVQFATQAVQLYYRADAWHNLAHLYESQGRWPEATRAADQFVSLTRGMSTDPIQIESLSDAGIIRWKAGWHAAARDAWDEMVRVTDRLQEQWDLAAEYFERIGDLAQARVYYLRGLRGYDPKHPGEASWFGNLAGLTRIYQQLGKLDSAEVWARAHDTRSERWPPRELPLLPDVLMRRGKSLEATRVSRDWLERQLRGGNTEGAALAALQLARLLLDAGQPDSALPIARRADSLAGAVRLTVEQIQARTLRGSALVRLGKKEAGVSLLKEAAALAEQRPSSNNLFDANLALGDALAGGAQTEGALAAYDQAARQTEQVTSGLGEDLDRAGYRERHLRPFDGAVRVLLRSPARPTRLDELIQWSSRRTAAALALSAAGNAGRLAETPPVPSLAALQRRLSPHEILLDYLVLDSAVAVLAIANDDARLVRLLITADTLRTWVERLRLPLVTIRSGRIDLARARFDAATSAELHSTLIAPLAAALSGKRRLLIVPDGPLHRLAFAALVVARPVSASVPATGASTRYLLDAFEMEYLPSPAFLRAPAERTRTQALAAVRLLAVGYGAPGGEAELAGLEEVWPRERITVLQGPTATEHAVKPEIQRFGIVHFAVHAQADARDPLASHLRLVADSSDDGFLHVNEIASQRLAAKLVVLSACETDAGPLYEGEGVMGLARGFLASGAGSVVATQWPVGAQTAVLMREFYRRLAAGEEPTTALRAAQLLMRTSARFTHPFYWAGLVLVR